MSAAKLFLVAGLLASSSVATPIQARSPYAVKDSHFVPPKWRQISPAPPYHNINLRIAVKQNKFDDLERHLYEGKSDVGTAFFHVPFSTVKRQILGLKEIFGKRRFDCSDDICSQYPETISLAGLT